MSVCVLHPNFGCLIQHCALFCQNASRVYASGLGPWEVSLASSGMLQIVTMGLDEFQLAPEGKSQVHILFTSIFSPSFFLYLLPFVL